MTAVTGSNKTQLSFQATIVANAFLGLHDMMFNLGKELSEALVGLPEVSVMQILSRRNTGVEGVSWENLNLLTNLYFFFTLNPSIAQQKNMGRAVMKVKEMIKNDDFNLVPFLNITKRHFFYLSKLSQMIAITHMISKDFVRIFALH